MICGNLAKVLSKIFPEKTSVSLPYSKNCGILLLRKGVEGIVTAWTNGNNKGVDQDVDGSTEQPVSNQYVEHAEQEPQCAGEEPANGLFGYAHQQREG